MFPPHVVAGIRHHDDRRGTPFPAASAVTVQAALDLVVDLLEPLAPTHPVLNRRRGLAQATGISLDELTNVAAGEFGRLERSLWRCFGLNQRHTRITDEDKIRRRFPGARQCSENPQARPIQPARIIQVDFLKCSFRETQIVHVLLHRDMSPRVNRMVNNGCEAPDTFQKLVPLLTVGGLRRHGNIVRKLRHQVPLCVRSSHRTRTWAPRPRRACRK